MNRIIKKIMRKFKKINREFRDLWWTIKNNNSPHVLNKLSLYDFIAVFTPDWIWNIIYSIDNFFVWLRKSFAYAWMLRKDRDWHDDDILRLLQFKLIRVKKVLVGTGYRTQEHDNEMANYIDSMLFLINRILTDDYLKDLDKNFKDVFGNTTLNNHLEFTYEKAKTKEESELASREKYAIHLKKEEEKKSDINKLFDLMKEYERLWG